MDPFLDPSPGDDSNESPHCSLDHNIAHILNLLDSPSEQPRSGDTLSDDDDDVSDTQPISAQILKDVVAYVEVRSGNDNRSGAISRELELLGATVEKKFTNVVTHVVFKAGRKLTQERAQKRGLHLVSVLWVDSCKQNLRHMSELLFPIVPAEKLATPVFARRLKKLKSMQPKDFDDDVASSADRGQKRRRKQAIADRWKVLETPGAGLLLGAAYVEDTQPKSPHGQLIPATMVGKGNEYATNTNICISGFNKQQDADLNVDVDADMDTDTTPLSFNLTVPDTPPSMREKLDSLRRKRLSLQHFAECGKTTQSRTVQETEPLQRRLFGVPENVSPQPMVATLVSPQPMVETLEIKAAKDANKDLTNECSVTEHDVEEEDPIPVHLIGSSTICVPNRRHRLLPLNPEPSVELLQPVYTDQCRQPGQNHFFPEIASRKSRKIKRKGGMNRDAASDGDAIKQQDRRKGSGKKSGKRKNDSEVGRSRKRKGSVEASGNGVSMTDLKGNVRGIDEMAGTMASDHPCQHKSGDSPAMNSVSESLGASGNAVRSYVDDGVRVFDVPSFSRGVVNSGSVVVPLSGTPLQTNQVDQTSLTNLSESSSKCSRFALSNKTEEAQIRDKQVKPCNHVAKKMPIEAASSTEEICTHSTSHTDSRRYSSREDRSLPVNVRTARCRTSNNELVSHCRVEKDRTVTRRCSVRLQQIELHQSRDTTDNVRQSVRDLASNLSVVSQSTSTQLSLSACVYHSNVLQNLTRPSRKSIDEFAFATKRLCHPSGTSQKRNTSCHGNTLRNSFCVGPAKKIKSVDSYNIKKNRSEGVQPNTSHMSSCDRNNGVSRDSACDTSNWKKVVITENQRIHEHPSKTLVMTSLHTDEQDVVRSVVKKLGGYRVVSGVNETTTHVICGNDRRTLNVLMGICRGSWLLSLEWVFKSLECNRWLDEEPYEQSDFFPAAQISRLERLTATGNYTQDLFSKHSPIYVVPPTVPSRADLVKLIKLCAGQVTQCSAKCRVCVGKQPMQPGVVTVSEQWVLDSITAHRALPQEIYRLDDVNDTMRGDSSPEY